MRTRPVWLLVIVLTLLAAACGDDGSSAPAPQAGATSSSTTMAEGDHSDDMGSTSTAPAGTSDTSEPSGTTVTTSGSAGPSFDGPPAEDFELALSDGSVFSPSAEQKPVYMIFWAEW